MIQHCNNLMNMGSTLLDMHFTTIILASLLKTYHPTIQTITTAAKANKSNLAPEDIIALISKEAKNHAIKEEWVKQAESALHSNSSKWKNPIRDAKKKSKYSDITCGNCGKPGHTEADCYSKGGGKEGQAPWQKKSKKKEKRTEESAAVTNDDDLFTFTCTSDYVDVAVALQVPKSRLGAIMDSGATQHFCPDWSKFINYCPLENQTVNTADG
jgi:hypothetical protein